MTSQTSIDMTDAGKCCPPFHPLRMIDEFVMFLHLEVFQETQST